MRRIKSTLSAPLLVLVVYVLLVSSRFINTDSLQLRDNAYLSMIILQLLIFILPGVFYCMLRGVSGERIKLKFISPGKIWFVIACFGVLVFGCTLINTAVFYIFGGESQDSLYNLFAPQGGDRLVNLVYTVIALAIVPAVTEEFIFRGIMLSEYSEYGVHTAVFMSGIMFAMLHFNIAMLPTYFFCGVVAAYAVYVTQSLWAGMMLHFLNNVYALFFEYVLWDVIKSPNSLIFFLFVIMTLFILFLVVSFSEAERILYNAGIKGEPSPPEAKKKEGGSRLFWEALVSPSFFACLIIFLVVTLVIK